MSLEQELREWTRQESICQCVELTQRAADRIYVLEAALRDLRDYFDARNANAYVLRINEVLAASETACDQVCVHGVHTKQNCYQCNPEYLGANPAKTEVDAAAERVMRAIEIGMGECGFKRSRWNEP